MPDTPEEWPPNERGEVAGLSDTTALDPNAENFCGAFDFLNGDPYICLPFVWRHGRDDTAAYAWRQ